MASIFPESHSPQKPGVFSVERIANMAEVDRIGNQLTRAFEGEAWHGPRFSMIQHSLYHAGQMAILKKVQGKA